MIEAVIERCAGIDVGKRFLVVCVMSGPLDAEPKNEIRKFGTIVAELERLRDWLIQEGCSHVVMESTGSYWKPVFNILEDRIAVVLANAFDVQNRRGHKTDPQPLARSSASPWHDPGELHSGACRERTPRSDPPAQTTGRGESS
jgi:transposase